MKKGLGIAALVVLVIIIVGFILIMINREKLVNMAVTKTVDAIETAMMKAEELPVSKEQAREIMDRARTKIKEGELDPEKARKIIEDFREFYEDKKLDSEEVQKLLNTLESAAQE